MTKYCFLAFNARGCRGCRGRWGRRGRGPPMIALVTDQPIQMHTQRLNRLRERHYSE